MVASRLPSRRPWAWFGAFAVGCGLMIFEFVEISVIGYNVQQPIWGTIGLLIALVSLACRSSAPAGCAGGGGSRWPSGNGLGLRPKRPRLAR